VFRIILRTMIFCRRSYMWPDATVKMWMVSGSSSGLSFCSCPSPPSLPLLPPSQSATPFRMPPAIPKDAANWWQGDHVEPGDISGDGELAGRTSFAKISCPEVWCLFISLPALRVDTEFGLCLRIGSERFGEASLRPYGSTVWEDTLYATSCTIQCH
jgi:hypothetical protein